ncbi:NUDIX domain-containing protein [Amycolatopsis sp. NPDC049253]|uniref:NUDIX domain-containing protein n=1 Tax=Amycolatopsis sp. NPDC049253 TaxID=3155274 RepID=UPI00342BF4A4
MREGWADPYATPRDVPDWADRQAAALVSYRLDERRRPLNPTGRTGRPGRHLGKWGENQAADPIVVAGAGGAEPQVLLILRRDCAEWAIPGGMVDPGETAERALVRELREETDVDLAGMDPKIPTRTYVDDWRNTDHAWASSTVALYRIEETLPPPVTTRPRPRGFRSPAWTNSRQRSRVLEGSCTKGTGRCCLRL